MIDGATIAFGLVMGSFANVVAYRVPRRISLGVSRSRCPTCLHTLTWWENIPLLSYLLLAGKCRNCRRRISVRYPLVELVTASGWLVVVKSIGLRPELPAFLWFTTTLVILSVIDLEHRKIPWRVVFPSFIAGVLLLLLAALRAEDLGTWARALAGAGIYWAPMLAIGLAVPKGMGGGDINLAAYLGLHLGWLGLSLVGVGAFAGVFIGASVGVLLVLVGSKGRKDTIPFGPSMALGAMVAIVFGRQLLDAWLGALGR